VRTLCGGKCSCHSRNRRRCRDNGSAGVVCVAATSTHASVGQQWKLSVRLDDNRASLLKKLSAEVGCSPSGVLRRSLDCYFAARSLKPAIQRPEAKVAPAGVRPLPITTGEGPKAASATSPESCLTTIVKAAPSTPSATVPTPPLPTRIADLITQARGFGSQLRRIRREQFQRAFAASVVAAESADNPQDSEVYAEMLRLGRTYRWLE